MKKRSTSDLPVPEELTQRFRRDPRFKRAFDALTPGRQRSYLYHFAAAKQSATRVARIDKAMPAIVERGGFVERRETIARGLRRSPVYSVSANFQMERTSTSSPSTPNWA